MTTEATKPSNLEPSALGTKEYWDNLYNREISNHALDATDVGTIWFDDSSAEDKVVDFLNEEVIGNDLLGLGEARKRGDFSLLDLGTGNGHFLVRLRKGEEVDSEEEEDEEGNGNEDEGKKWVGRMMGVDYSERSIEFAKRIAADKRENEKEEGMEVGNEIEFITWDIMKEDPSPKVLNEDQSKGWDIVLDKGTFDAISLSEETDENGKRIFEGYRGKVLALVRIGGVAVVTSCNWTEEELIEWFVGEREGEGEGEGEGEQRGKFEVLRKIEYRSFSFGGVKGQTVCSVCFRKC